MSPLFLIPPGCFALDLGIVMDMLDQNLVHFKLNFNEKLPFSCFCNFAAIFKKIPSTFSQFSSNIAVAYSPKRISLNMITFQRARFEQIFLSTYFFLRLKC